MTPFDHAFWGLCYFMRRSSYIVTHHLAKFNSHRSCGSRGMTYLMCHMTLQDHVIKGYCNFMDRSYSLYVTTCKPCCSGSLWKWIYNVFNLSRDHEFKGLCNFCAWKLLIASHCLARFGDHNSCSSRNITDLIFHVTLKGCVNNGLVALRKEAPLCTSIYQPCQVR